MKKLTHQSGVSLLELLIYIAIFAILAVFLVSIFTVIIRSRATANARFDVEENLRFAVEKIQQSVFDSSLTLVNGSCPLTSLELRIGSATTTYQVSGGVLQIQEGSGNPFNAVTASNVVVSTPADANCLFTKISNPSPAQSTIQLKIKVRYNDQGRDELKFSDSAQTTISLR